MKSLFLLFIGAISFGQEAAARVYVYRYARTQHHGWPGKALVFCDEKVVAIVPGGRYAAITLSLGKHELRGRDKQNGMYLDAELGKSYYMRMDSAGSWKLVSVPEGQGVYEIRALKAIDAAKVKACDASDSD
ncbi:MAG: hypothetical protein WB992_25140 [Bryobacteraceae bacterium]